MKQYAEHDRVGVCHRLRNDGLYSRAFAGGYPYIKSGIITRSTKAQPVYSYGKNYTNSVGQFALFVWSTESDKEKVEKRLDQVAETVTADAVSLAATEGTFTYVD